jgi:hypothetical protein
MHNNSGVCECDGKHRKDLKKHLKTNKHIKQMLRMSPCLIVLY